MCKHIQKHHPLHVAVHIGLRTLKEVIARSLVGLVSFDEALPFKRGFDDACRMGLMFGKISLQPRSGFDGFPCFLKPVGLGTRSGELGN